MKTSCPVHAGSAFLRFVPHSPRSILPLRFPAAFRSGSSRAVSPDKAAPCTAYGYSSFPGYPKYPAAGHKADTLAETKAPEIHLLPAIPVPPSVAAPDGPAPAVFRRHSHFLCHIRRKDTLDVLVISDIIPVFPVTDRKSCKVCCTKRRGFHT